VIIRIRILNNSRADSKTSAPHPETLHHQGFEQYTITGCPEPCPSKFRFERVTPARDGLNRRHLPIESLWNFRSYRRVVNDAGPLSGRRRAFSDSRKV